MNKAKLRTNKNKAFYRLGLWFLLLITVVLLGTAGFKAVKQSVWNGKDRLSLITLSGDRIELINLLPPQKKQLVWEVPSDLVVEVPSGYGPYQLKKVFTLGELDKKGGELLLKTTSNLFGLKVSAYRVEGKTNLSWWDSLRINWLNRTKAYQTSRLDLSGQMGRIDQIVNESLFDQVIAREAVPVAVLNATGVAGEANQVARLITNLGGQVVTIGNSEAGQDESEIWIVSDDLKSSVTLAFLESITGTKNVKVEPKAIQYRADIVVIVGKRYAVLPSK